MPIGSGTSPSSFMLKRFTIMPKTPVSGAGWMRGVLVMSSSWLRGYDMKTPATAAV